VEGGKRKGPCRNFPPTVKMTRVDASSAVERDVIKAPSDTCRPGISKSSTLTTIITKPIEKLLEVPARSRAKSGKA